MVERNVKKGRPRLGEHFVAIAQSAFNPNAPSADGDHVRRDLQRSVDRYGPAVAHEDPRRNRREAVPGRQQAAGLVERRRDQAAMGDPRAALVPLVEAKGGPVAVCALLGGHGKTEAGGIRAAAEAGRIVMRRNSQRMPPRSWWARKKLSEPAVAIAAEAEISSASAAAATIWANR